MNILKRLKVAALVIWGDDLVLATARVAPPADELTRITDSLTRNTQNALEGVQARLDGLFDELKANTEGQNELGLRLQRVERDVSDVWKRLALGDRRFDALDRVTGLRPGFEGPGD